LRKLGGDGVALHVVYEAGPTGYVVYRRLQQLKLNCIVVAPSKLPYEKGVRQKTDRRDALMLARLHRAGELTGIHVPDAVDESIRDLTRARADAVHDLTRRGNFHSVPHLRQTILDYIAANNRQPKPFVWTASAELILGKVAHLCYELT
jgi:transposase